MTHVITQACISAKEQTCVETCPVDCIIGENDDQMLYIDPVLCIDCAACVPACPVNAIFLDTKVPDDQTEFIELNRDYFVDKIGTRQKVAEMAKSAGLKHR